MLVTPVHLVSAQTTGADITSLAQQTNQMVSMSFQCIWTGTTHGTIKIQGSNKPSPSGSVAADWTDLGTSSVITNGSQPAGTASSLTIDNGSGGVPWAWVRLVFTRTDGSGVMDVYFNGKGF